MDFEGDTIHFDATNPDARQYIWDKVKKNYYTKGIKIFWLDEAEPEYTVYDFDNYRYSRGTNLQIGNIYPLEYSRAFYEGQDSAGQNNIVNLVRCAWAGSSKYGALVWSGDIGMYLYTLPTSPMHLTKSSKKPLPGLVSAISSLPALTWE
jgi:alpha-D-xyloside xylohydrolase